MAIAAGKSDVTQAESPPAQSLAGFWKPRFWPAWLLIGWMKFVSLLPWLFAIRLHKAIGRLCFRLMSRHRVVVERNIELSFPKLNEVEVKALVREHFENLGACLAETAFAWFGRIDKTRIKVEIEGDEHVYAALAKERGVILYTGHFTPLEICTPILNEALPRFGFMFHRRRNLLIDEFQRRGRKRFSDISLSNDDVRSMLRALAQNSVVWYAPDQSFSTRSCIELPFFGSPQLVSTATTRLARVSGAAVIPFIYQRLPDDSGYSLRFESPLDDIGNGDDVDGTRQLVEVLQRFVEECPAQYAWTKQRLKHRLYSSAERHDPPRAAVAADTGSNGSRSRATLTTLLAIVGVALFIAVADNGAFFSGLFRATDGDDHRMAVAVSMFLLIVTALVAALSLAPGKRTFKVVAASLLIVSSASAYYMSNYGVIFDASMIRNIAETDAREAGPLLTLDFLLHVAAFGVAPAVLISMLPLGGIGWRRELSVRTGAIVGMAVVLIAVLYPNYGPVSFFAHQNHVLRMQINPVYPLYSAFAYWSRADDKPPAVREPLAAVRAPVAPDSAKPTLFVFVMGETARADRFSLNGYSRDTNRFTPQLNVINFSNVDSCGTSTAESVPCIFSRFDRGDFSHTKFAQNEPLYQTLSRLGIDTVWRDNSTGCKEICDPGSFQDLAGATDPGLCHDNVCFDEILLGDFESEIADSSRDHFLVLHQRGSHGPAYYLDTPDAFKAWLPECDSPSVQNCDIESINNAYDNTILYTDYFLAQVIELLQRQSARYATAMFYVSDHGESLGEKGLYLHGLPYALAPEEQTKVPMMFWASPEFYTDRAIDPSCLKEVAARETRHAAVFHTVLSAFDIVSPAYDSSLDLLAHCKYDRTKQVTDNARRG